MIAVLAIARDVRFGQAAAAGSGLRQARGTGLPILNIMGIRKALVYTSGLALATGGPITMFSASDFVADVKQRFVSPPAATASANPHPSAGSPAAVPATLPASPAEAMPTPSLPEVLRFDVTVEWVMQRWPRVSTGLPHLQLQGYRVPLVTGTQISDVAGSLTYYFNAGQKVQRITLKCSTGDPRALVALLTERFRFVRRLTNDPGLIVYEAVDSDNNKVGKAEIRSAAVVKASQPYTRFDVDLVMDRAG